MNSAIKSVASALGQGGLGGVLLGVGAATAGLAIGLGIATVKASGDFQQAMLNNVAHAGLAKNQIESVSQALFAMGPAVGKGPTELAQALYPILSGLSSMTDQSGKAKVALAELDDAAKSVAGTATDTATVARAATAAFNAYNLQTTSTATNISRMNTLFDVMNQTVTEGNMKWSEYAVKVGDLAAKAAQSHVSFTEANAALAVFTNTGDSVQLAGTHLGALFQSMSLDVDRYVARAKKLHESFDATKFQSLDLAGKLKYLEDITGNDAGKIKAIVGNKTLAATILKLRDHANDYKNALNDLNHAQGATQVAFDTNAKGFNFAMQRLAAASQVLLITIGNGLLPLLTQLVNAVVPLVSGFAAWLTSTDKVNSAGAVMGAIWRTVSGVIATLTPYFRAVWAALTQIGAFLAATFVPVWQQLVATFKSDLLPAWNDLMQALQPIMPELKLFGAILGGIVVAAILLAVAVIAGLVKALAGLLETTIKIFSGVVNIISGAIQVVSGIVALFVDLITGKWDKLGADIMVSLKGWIPIVQGVWQIITSIFTGAIDFIKNLVGGFVSTVSNMISGIGNAMSGIHLPGHAAGILNSPIGHMAVVGERGPELMYIPRGASIFPNSALSSFGGGRAAAAGPTNIFYISIGTMARSQAEVRRMVDLIEQEVAARFRGQTPGYASGGVW